MPDFENTVLQDALNSTSQAIEKFLDPLISVPNGPEGRVVQAMRHALFAGGKRVRPFLVFASATLFGVNQYHARRVAAAVECVHTYSLIHDDLPAMDDDDLRRGKPTVHKKFDEATAILAGDALLTLAFEMLADVDTHPDAGVRLNLITALSQAAGYKGMVGGQMMDMSAENLPKNQNSIYRLQQMKTGALISFSVEAGAILGQASNRDFQHLAAFARDLGLAFQIADDILDVESSEQEAGKAVGKDSEAGKATLVSLMGVERARQQADMLSQQSIEHLKEYGEEASLLRAIAHFAINRRN